MNIGFLAGLVSADAFIGSFTGFGTSALLVPVLILWYSLSQALAITGLASFLNNGARALANFKSISWKLVAKFSVTAIACAFVGAHLTSTLEQAVVLRIMGGMLMCYAAFNLWWRPITFSLSMQTLLIGGAAYGFIEGLTGTAGILRAALFIAYPLSAQAYIATNAMIALIIDAVRVATYIGYGTQLPYAWWTYIIFALSAAIGAWGGNRLMRRLHDKIVRIIVLYTILIVGTKLLIMPA